MEDFQNYLIYDIEIFKYDALVVFKDIHKNVVAIFHNDFDTEDRREELVDLIRGKTLVGYNNHFYDDYILTGMIQMFSNRKLKELNDRIIRGEEPNIDVSYLITSLDCFQQIDVSRPSLKKVEANMGKNIMETSIAFDIDRELTQDEINQTIKYCAWDVDNTVDIFKIRWDSYFTPKQIIIDMLDPSKRKRAAQWNTTTISANVLTDRPSLRWSDYRLGKVKDDDFGTFEIYDKVPPEAVDLWSTKEKGSVTIEDLGCSIEFAFGGLHGVHSKRHDFSNVKLLDVASMYPNIIINNHALGIESTKIYKTIVDKRIAVKHTDEKLQKALKLVINSCYGLLNNQYSLLYNSKASRTVCIIGQIALYDLSKRLYEAGCTLINLNTDGVAFCGEESQYKPVWEAWEQEYGLTLELDEFDRWIQKDVNNYIAIQGDYIKVKGADAGKYHDSINLETGEVKGLSWCRTNTAAIVSKCLVDKIIYGKDPITTIEENLDKPILFQFVLQAGNTYKGTFDQYGHEYQKVNRVFASNTDDVTLYKLRQDGGIVRFPDTPTNMFVWNEDLRKLEDFESKIDKNFYYQLAIKACERWDVSNE